MRKASASGIAGLMIVGFSATLLVLIPLDPQPPRNAEAWRLLALGGAWFAIVFAGVRAGLSRRAARLLTVGVGAFWYSVVGVIQDDGSGLWTAGLLLVGIPMPLALSVAASALAEAERDTTA